MDASTACQHKLLQEHSLPKVTFSALQPTMGSDSQYNYKCLQKKHEDIMIAIYFALITYEPSKPSTKNVIYISACWSFN